MAEAVSAEVHLVADLAEEVSVVDLAAEVSLAVDLVEIGNLKFLKHEYPINLIGYFFLYLD